MPAALSIAPLLAPLDNPRALELVAPEAVWALPAAARAGAWLASRARFEADLAWALRIFDADTAAAALPLNLRQQPLPAAAPAPAAATGSSGPPLASRASHGVALELGASLAGHADLMRVACMVIGTRFIESRDPKWCALRADLGAVVAAASGSGACVDPLAALIAEADHAVCASAAVAGAAAGPARAAAVTAAEQQWAALLRAAYGVARAPALADADPVAVAAAIRRATKEALHAAVSARQATVPAARLRAEFAAPVVENYPALGPAYLAKVRDTARTRSAGVARIPSPPPPPSSPQVSRPMDLRTIHRKAEAGEYGADLLALRADAQLIVDNSRAFNGPSGIDSPGAAFTAAAEEAFRDFERRLSACLHSVQSAAAATSEQHHAHAPGRPPRAPSSAGLAFRGFNGFSGDPADALQVCEEGE